MERYIFLCCAVSSVFKNVYVCKGSHFGVLSGLHRRLLAIVRDDEVCRRSSGGARLGAE